MLPEGTFSGRAAVVTGGGSGLGRAIALELARLGAGVVVAGRREEPLAETVSLIEAGGGEALAQPTDVREPDAVETLMDAAVERFGRLDVLVNNAAGNFIVKAEDLSPNGWRAVVGIVLDGSFLCSRAAGRRMIEQGDGGAILSVIASYAWTGGPGTVHSAAAKAGILALTRTLAVEWAPHGIRVNAIAPGPIPTEGVRKAFAPPAGSGAPDLFAADRAMEAYARKAIPLGRWGTPRDIANTVAFLASPAGDWVTGSIFVVDGGEWLAKAGPQAAPGAPAEPGTPA